MNPRELATAAAQWSKLTAPDPALEQCAAAVATLIATLSHVTRPWPPDIELGATMLTARLYRRRNSPNGVESLTDMGATYVSRYDSDIARLLKIDSFALPVAL